MGQYKDHKNNIIKLIHEAAGRFHEWEIYSSFLELAAISISNAVDWTQAPEREKTYLEIISRFNKREAEIFPKILAELVQALGCELADCLGSIYNELEFSNKWTGQFFTPIDISKMMGAMVIHDAVEELNRKGYITVSEPTCGGGSTIIGLAQAMAEKGLNYQKQMVVTAVDIDIKSVAMTYLQLSLLGIPAVVIHGNSLTVKEYSHWYTPMYILDGWQHKLFLARATEKIESIANENMMISDESKPEEMKPAV